MTALELRDLLVRDIARSNGGGLTRWRRAVGRIKTYPLSTHAHCNWEVQPAGTQQEIAVVERAADAMRQSHPFVDEA